MRSYGDYSALQNLTWSLLLSIIVNGIIAWTVQVRWMSVDFKQAV